MQKIMLTVEQGKLVDYFSKNSDKPAVLKAHVYGWKDEKNKSLNDLSIDQMARILYEPNSYEVEKPQIYSGNWVTRINSYPGAKGNRCKGRTFKVNRIDKDTFEDKDGVKHVIENIRHATKEEIMWAELGRDYRETKIGDCISLNGEYLKVQENMGCERYKNHISHLFAKGILISGHSDGFYPANSFIKLPVGDDS